MSKQTPISGEASASIIIAKIRSAHGLKGEMKLHHFGAHIADFRQYETLTSDSGQPLSITKIRRGRNDSEIIVAFDEIADRDAAERLIGQTLRLASTALAALPDDEYYHRDLIGLTAVDAQQHIFGVVSAVYNFGSGDILGITRADDASKSKDNEFLHPFKPEYVTDINLDQKQCTLHHVMDHGDG